MPQASLKTCEKLFEVIFPGEDFSLKKVPELASAVKALSEDVIKQHGEVMPPSGPDTGKGKLTREFDFSKYQKRYIALNIAYQGFNYHGFARQEGIDKTIEEELFMAMRKTRLVPSGKSWREMVYSRGGRTDKGVSAAGQVIALEVRSKALVDELPCQEDEELDYPGMINRVLSPQIRVLGWKTVDRSFSARFSAESREYKYFFVDEDNELNLSAMQEAANHLVGEHDFRNFCKADVPTVTNFVRSILSVSLKRTPLFQIGSFSAIELHISGTAFLWHQIRCIAAVLLMVGRGQESPNIILSLLDVTSINQKPQYVMASEQPLLLYRCAYDNLEFIRSRNVLETVKKEISSEISSLLSKSILLMNLRATMDIPMESDFRPDLKRKATKNHVPLLERHREPSIEERLERLRKSNH